MTATSRVDESHITQTMEMAIKINSLRTPEKKSCIEYADSPNDV